MSPPAQVGRVAAPWPPMTGMRALLGWLWCPVCKPTHQAMRRYGQGPLRVLWITPIAQHEAFVAAPRERALPGGREKPGLQAKASIPRLPQSTLCLAQIGVPATLHYHTIHRSSKYQSHRLAAGWCVHCKAGTTPPAGFGCFLNLLPQSLRHPATVSCPGSLFDAKHDVLEVLPNDRGAVLLQQCVQAGPRDYHGRRIIGAKLTLSMGRRSVAVLGFLDLLGLGSLIGAEEVSHSASHSWHGFMCLVASIP